MERNRRRFVATVGATLGAALAGCTGNGGNGGNGNGGDDAENGSENGTGGNATGVDDVTGTVAEDQTSDMLAIVDHTYFETASGSGVRGTVENVSDQRLVLAQVKVTPTQTGAREEGKKYPQTKTARIEELAPGATAEFEVTFDESERVQQVGGYELWTTAQTESQGGGR